MKSKLLIVADLGLVKAYKLDFTLNHTPRLEQLEKSCWKRLVVECSTRSPTRFVNNFLWPSAKEIKKNLSRDLIKVGQKELLDQFLNADSFVI
jgi:hypothetical protein